MNWQNLGCYQLPNNGPWVAHNWLSFNGGPWYCQKCGCAPSWDPTLQWIYYPINAQDPRIAELEASVKTLETRVQELEKKTKEFVWDTRVLGPR